MSVSSSKDPVKVRAGELGARARWGGEPPRVVRIDDLPPSLRRLVLALVSAARNEMANTEGQSPVTAAPREDHHALATG
ncbi:MAG: hypothetical protein L0227_09850 [Chloroflexi bacterium]|nr:hypothetical protein [Chloroflexota bacterium]